MQGEFLSAGKREKKMRNPSFWKVPHLRVSNRNCWSGPNSGCQGLNKDLRPFFIWSNRQTYVFKPDPRFLMPGFQKSFSEFYQQGHKRPLSLLFAKAGSVAFWNRPRRQEDFPRFLPVRSPVFRTGNACAVLPCSGSFLFHPGCPFGQFGFHSVAASVCSLFQSPRFQPLSRSSCWRRSE